LRQQLLFPVRRSGARRPEILTRVVLRYAIFQLRPPAKKAPTKKHSGFWFGSLLHIGTKLLAFLAGRGNLRFYLCSPKESDMPSGTVKFFNIERGFGFTVPDDGGSDVFVHIKAVEKAGYTGLVEGVKVTFDIVDNRGRQAADNLQLK
jgi:CspA family cold shock protein